MRARPPKEHRVQPRPRREGMAAATSEQLGQLRHPQQFRKSIQVPLTPQCSPSTVVLQRVDRFSRALRVISLTDCAFSVIPVSDSALER